MEGGNPEESIQGEKERKGEPESGGRGGRKRELWWKGITWYRYEHGPMDGHTTTVFGQQHNNNNDLNLEATSSYAFHVCSYTLGLAFFMRVLAILFSLFHRFKSITIPTYLPSIDLVGGLTSSNLCFSIHFYTYSRTDLTHTEISSETRLFF